jgi:hypothetical protein
MNWAPDVKDGPYKRDAEGLDKRLQHGHHELPDPDTDSVHGLDKLGDYHLSLESAVRSSMFTQSMTKKWRSGLDIAALQTELRNPSRQMKSSFNLPICDLTVLIPKNADYMGEINGKDYLEADSGHWKKAVMCMCGMLVDIPYHAAWMDVPAAPECKPAVAYNLADL